MAHANTSQPGESAASQAGKEALGTVKQGAMVIGSLVAIMWVIEIIDQILFVKAGVGLTPIDSYGIYPRSVSGLKGILFAPFLHGGWDHIISNTVPFAAMGGLIFLSRGLKGFLVVSGLIALLAGLGTWAIGNLFTTNNAVHIGASGVIFGYLGFLLAAGIFERSISSIVIAVVVGAAYGGVIAGVLPGTPGISWEGHLMGFLGGVWVAYYLSSRQKKKAAKKG